MMRAFGPLKISNLGFFLLLALSSFGGVFETPWFFAAGQETGSDGAGDSLVTPNVSAPPASECPINCANGSECKLGEHDFSFHPKEGNGADLTFLQTTSREGWYCDCPAGWTGLRCNRRYDVCPMGSTNSRNNNNGSSKDIETHFCYHGGKCIAGLTDGTHDSIDDSQRFCDCSEAMHNGVPYFGKYCEIEGAIQCSDDSDEYCTAQGTCKEDFANKAYPCDCRKGHRGPHCEFMLGSVPNCTLPCGATPQELGGVGTCRLGIKTFENARYEDFWSGHDGNYQYCKCSEGWFGDNCEIPGIPCGKAHCFNGASCRESQNNNGESTFACDCRDAGHLGKSWAGQYCENPETSTCNAGPDADLNANGHLFCTNGGTCKDPNNPHLGCNCPDGQFGPSCEFHNKDDAVCSLQCQNDGKCRSGMKDTSLLDKLGKGLDGFDTSHSELFEHCVCPRGYFGIQCEHKLEICPSGDHVCLHGSKCIARNEGGTDGEKHYVCDCDSAFDSLEKYAGKFCQYSSTDICTKNGQPGMGKANFAFCVNNGMCKGKVEDGEPAPGCICPEGFSGQHCEYIDSDDDSAGDDDGSDYYYKQTTKNGAASQSSMSQTKQKSIVIGLSVAVIAIVMIFIVVIARAIFRGDSPAAKAADAQAAVNAEESAAANTSGIVSSASTDGDLEDIEVEDYVNNHSTVLTDREMTNVQLV